MKTTNMSGVKKIVQAENKGLAQVTNEDLKQEGIGSATQEDAKEKEDKPNAA